MQYKTQIKLKTQIHMEHFLGNMPVITHFTGTYIYM